MSEKFLKFGPDGELDEVLGFLTTEVDNSTIEYVSDQLRVKADGINDTHIDFVEKIGDIIKLKYPTYSYKVNYAGDNISSVEYFNGVVQTVGFRIAQIVLSYTNDFVTNEDFLIYDTVDGTTVLKTITRSLTYSGDFITNVTVSET